MERMNPIRRTEFASMKAWALMLLLALACGSERGIDTATDVPRVRQGHVVRVVDGDTIHVQILGGAKEKVRLIGIDTPEVRAPVEEYGKEASAFTKDLLLDKEVWLELDVEHRDRYDRLLAYVWLREPQKGDRAEMAQQMANAIIIAGGYANQLTVPPNVRYTQHFRDLEKQARNDQRGLWK